MFSDADTDTELDFIDSNLRTLVESQSRVMHTETYTGRIPPPRQLFLVASAVLFVPLQGIPKRPGTPKPIVRMMVVLLPPSPFPSLLVFIPRYLVMKGRARLSASAP
jgi:hypothetical protein